MAHGVGRLAERENIRTRHERMAVVLPRLNHIRRPNGMDANMQHYIRDMILHTFLFCQETEVRSCMSSAIANLRYAPALP